ncbi:hypothetical protein P43SY_010414 [Pythium insidiosum]|uniref:Protein kinase domain-containing protein n=1 Tax=Pythium insidiosum TaxID=114742 RepID=A0AAD5LU92_PYTIN|nr:hypothetical protein P43SY_010414 [Pythium insidiosum]
MNEMTLPQCDLAALFRIVQTPSGQQCQRQSGYVFSSGAPPSDAVLAKLCASQACEDIVGQVDRVAREECTLASGVRLRASLVEPYKVACGPSTSAAPSSRPSKATTRPPEAPVAHDAASSSPSSSSSSSSSSGLSAGATTALVAGVLLVCLVVAAVLIWRRRSPAASSKPESMRTELLPPAAPPDRASSSSGSASSELLFLALLELPEMAALRLPMASLKLTRKVSRGAFGEVYAGTLDGHHDVAVKRLAAHLRPDATQRALFLDEAKLLSTIPPHDRIVRFLGICWSDPLDLHVVTEFVAGGDLRALLVTYARQRAPMGFSREKLRIALHVAQALAHLHAQSVLHRDLKSRNVLLTKARDAKLVDFGVSRERVDHTMTQRVGTVHWMAPEVMKGEHYGDRADIFSFGVVLSELDTHQLPYAVDGRALPAEAVMLRTLMGTLELSFSAHADPVVVRLAQQCAAGDPDQRPSAAAVLATLEQVLRACDAE